MLCSTRYSLFYRLRKVFFALCIFAALYAYPTYASTTRVGHAYFEDINTTLSTSTQKTILSIPDGQDSISYTFPKYTTPFAFNAAGLTFVGQIPDGTLEATMTTYMRTGETLVRHLELLGDDRKDNDDVTYATAPVIVDQARSFTLTLTLHRNNTATPYITDFDVIYLNTLTQAPALGVQAATAQTPTDSDTITGETSTEETQYPTSETPLFSTPPDSTLNIVSRNAWGADESYRFSTDATTKEQTIIWPSEYIQPQVFIVHHTAGSDGGEDPAATIRAIYYFHAVVYGWGDIGYNYLIDPAGHIYEGRSGGDGVVGGHAYNSSTRIGFNTGSVGISLLGCYESTENGCITQTTHTQTMLDALQALVTEKAELFDINVAERITFHGTEVYRLIGHRDVSPTLCPGDTTIDYLNIMRATVATNTSVSQKLHDSAMQEAWILDDQDNVVDPNMLQADTAYTLKMTVKNTGVRRWLRKKTYITISSSADGSTPTQFLSDLWPATNGHIKWDKGTKKVYSQNTITFTIPIHTPDSFGTELDIYVHIYANVKYPPLLREVGSAHQILID